MVVVPLLGILRVLMLVVPSIRVLVGVLRVQVVVVLMLRVLKVLVVVCIVSLLISEGIVEFVGEHSYNMEAIPIVGSHGTI